MTKIELDGPANTDCILCRCRIWAISKSRTPDGRLLKYCEDIEVSCELNVGQVTGPYETLGKMIDRSLYAAKQKYGVEFCRTDMKMA